MSDEYKTKGQLIIEMKDLRQENDRLRLKLALSEKRVQEMETILEDYVW